MEKILDLRLEKIFVLASRYRLGVIFDLFNVFNADTINSWGTTYGNGGDWSLTSYSVTGGHSIYGLVTPRQARVGLRLVF